MFLAKKTTIKIQIGLQIKTEVYMNQYLTQQDNFTNVVTQITQ